MYARNQVIEVTALKCRTKSIIEREGNMLSLYCRVRSQQFLMSKTAGKLPYLVHGTMCVLKMQL